MTAYAAWLILIAGMTATGLVVIALAVAYDHGSARGWWRD